VTESSVPTESDPSGGWDPPADEVPQTPYRVPGATPAPRPDGWFSSTTAASTSGHSSVLTGASGTIAKAGFFSDLPFRAPASVAGWIVAGGSAIAAVSFLLPWAQVGVSGTRLDPDYFGRWGLANPSYLLLVAAAVAMFLVTTIPNRLPVVARTIALPILLGGIFLGLAWSYATGTYGTGPGVDAMSFGAILIVAGGMVELRGPGKDVPGT
jgi:hypothetical protein